MKKVFFVLALGQVMTLSAQQFNGGATNTTTDIYRSGNVGIGQASAVALGAKLHIAQIQGSSELVRSNSTPTTDIRLERKFLTNTSNGFDMRYWDINNAGESLSFLTGATTATTQVMEISSTGLGIGTINGPKGALQIGQKFVIHNGADIVMGRNYFYNSSLGRDARLVAADKVAAIRFDAAGNIMLQTAPNSTNTPITTWTNGVTILNNGKVGIGNATPTEQLHVVGNTIIEGSFTVKGTNTSTTGTNEFKVDNQGYVWARDIKVDFDQIPDYVFEPSYQLPTLSELKTYIETEKHLPNIPSAADYKKEGKVNVGELNLKLLEKVEELTLYILELKATNEDLQNQINSLKK